MSRNNVAAFTQLAMDLDSLQQGSDQSSVAFEGPLEALTRAVDRINFRLERIERYLHIHTTPSAAGPKLASIPELLEHILLHLPVRDLLLAQRVSRLFKEVIDKSGAIQRALFFAPESQPISIAETNVRINPLLADKKSYIEIPLYNEEGHAFKPVFIKEQGWNTRKLRVVKSEVSTNVYSEALVKVQLEITLGRLPGSSCFDCVGAVGQSSYGSWRRMYLTQPPVRTYYYQEDSPNAGGLCLSGDLQLTFGELCPWKV